MKKILCIVLTAVFLFFSYSNILAYDEWDFVYRDGDLLFDNLSDKVSSISVKAFDADGVSTVSNLGNRVRLCDGDLKTVMNVSKNTTRSGEITFKFSESISINKIVIYDPSAGTKKFKISSSADGKNWNEFYTYDKWAEGIKYCYFEEVTTFYIKIAVSETTTAGETSYYNINFSEIEFYNVKNDTFRLESIISEAKAFISMAESSDKPYYESKLTSLDSAVEEGERILKNAEVTQLQIEKAYENINSKYLDASRFLNYPDDAYNKILSNWKNMLTSQNEAWTGEQKAYFANTVNNARSLMSSMNKDNSSVLWKSTGSLENMKSSGSNSSMMKMYGNVRTMALAYTHKYSALKGDATLKSNIVYALGILNNYYYGKTEWFGSNQWNLVIGLQKTCGEIVALLYDEIDKEILGAFANNAYSQLRPDYMKFSGTNCYDIAFGAALYGAYLKCDYLIENLIKKLMNDTVYNENLGDGDGYYTDGSYLFHGTVPYSGGYGYIGYKYFNSVFALVKDSVWILSDEGSLKEYMKNAVYETYLPKLINGNSPMMFNGRAITSLNNERTVGYNILSVLADTAYLLDNEEKSEILGMIKYHIEASGSDEWKDMESESLWKVMNDSSVVAQSPVDYNRIYRFEDRIIHKRSEYALGLSMYSKWVMPFETLDGQNSKGWLSNAGATYFYDADVSHYTDKYLHIYDYMRVPGVTAEKVEYPVVNSLTSEMQKADNNYAGGVTLNGTYGAAGFRPDNYNSSLSGNKSYFMFDDEVVMIGSEINADGETETTVDQRIIEDNTINNIRINSVYHNLLSSDDKKYENVTTAHIKGRISKSEFGYYFPKEVSLNINKNYVSKNSSDVDWYSYGDNDIQSGTLAALTINHGLAPSDAGYCYAVLPGYSETETTEYANSPDICVLSDDDSWHGVYEKNLNIWSIVNFENSLADSGKLSTDKKSAVMMQKTENEISIAISDPTREGTEKVTVTVDETATSVINCDENLKVISLSPIVIEADVLNTQGKTLEISLDITGEASGEPEVVSYVYYDYGIFDGDLIRIAENPATICDKRLALMFVKLSGIENMECGLAYSLSEDPERTWVYLPNKNLSDGIEMFGMCLTADLSKVCYVCPYVKDPDGNIKLFEENTKKIIPLPLNQPSLERWKINNKMNNTEFIVFEIK